MAKFELNIYGQNDEIINTHKTDHVRWGVLTAALSLQKEIADLEEDEQFEKLSAFAKEIFIGLTDEELQKADALDIINNFNQIAKMAGKIKGSKNA